MERKSRRIEIKELPVREKELTEKEQALVVGGMRARGATDCAVDQTQTNHRDCD